MAEPYLSYPSEWQKCTLEPSNESEAVIAVGSGTTPSTAVDGYWDGDIPWLTPKDITRRTGGIFVSETERRITTEGVLASSLTLYPVGTVMLTKRAPVGFVVVNSVPMAINQGFLAFTCGQRLRPLYLAYWLRANRPYLDKIANGSTYPELYQSDLFELEISIPPLQYQEHVLDVIGSLQFLSSLCIPLEHVLTEPEKLQTLTALRSRVEALGDQLLPLLLSGKINLAQLKNVTSQRDEKAA